MIADHNADVLLTGQAANLPLKSSLFLFRLAPSAAFTDRRHAPDLPHGTGDLLLRNLAAGQRLAIRTFQSAQTVLGEVVILVDETGR